MCCGELGRGEDRISYTVGSNLTNSHGTRDDLIVDSRLTYTDGTVLRGNVTFGGTAALSHVTIVNGSSRQAHPLNFAAEQIRGTDRQRVLLNFFEARALTISNVAIQATILAPHAEVAFPNGVIDGSLISASINGSGQAHLSLFQGCLPVPRKP